MVAGEVKQLRSLLAQQAAPQLSSTIQILDGPIAAAAAAGAATGHATSKLSKAGSTGTDAASIFPALAAAAVAGDAGRASEPDVDGCSDTGMPARAFSDMADALSCLGPTANDLVKDYAEAYASMKENMEIRLRHEQRRGDFLQVGGPAAAGADNSTSLQHCAGLTQRSRASTTTTTSDCQECAMTLLARCWLAVAAACSASVAADAWLGQTVCCCLFAGQAAADRDQPQGLNVTAGCSSEVRLQGVALSQSAC